MSDEVLIGEADGEVEIVINWPDQRSAVNGAVSQDITDAFEVLDSKADPRCAILAGKGTVLSAGTEWKIEVSA
ncbi:MAG: hypothetical protein KUG65_05495 [Sphingomonadaceae bacterium]|nr:hypothetical protein [Sphingomonadaceae bacterium]